MDNVTLSEGTLHQLKASEATKQEILEKEEHPWRLKISALWLEARENNSKFFNNYENFQKNINTIWEIEDQDGNIVNSL